MLGRRAAAAAVRDGAAVRPGAAAARRADHRHGRRGPPRLLVRDPRGRRAGPHRAVRDPLPRGGRPVRRPDRADEPGPDRRRRHRLGDQGAGRRPHRPGHPRPRRPPRRSRAARAASSRVEVRGDTVLLHAKDTDAVARYLLTETDARDLEITAAGPRGRVPGADRRHRRPTPTARSRSDDHHRPSTPPPAGSRRSAASTSPCSGIELQADAAQPPHDHLHAGVPGRAVLRVRRQPGLERRAPATATSRRTSWSRWRCTAPR